MAAAAPAFGGFGKAPAAGGFGAPAAAPAAGGFGAAPAAGGFGAPPAAGGFGKAPAAAGFGAPAAAPAAGGFGAAPAAGGFGAAPAAGGFGKAPVAGGFGAPAAAPAAGGFGAAPAGGFGAAAPAAGGFGKAPGFGGGFGAPAAGGFGAAPAAPAPVAVYSPDLNVADLSRHATIGRYLMQMDSAYNAMSADCKFRTFVFNMCPAGTSARNERYAYEVLGGKFPERQWVEASRENPDPENMVPAPLHFMSGLLTRTDKQREMVTLLHKKADTVAEKAAQLRKLNAENANAFRNLKEKTTMLERQALLTLSKVETLRQRNLPLGEEKHKILGRAAWLRSQLNAPGSFKATLAEIEPFIGAGAIAAAGSSSGGAGTSGGADGANGGTFIDPVVLQSWARFLGEMEAGIARLQAKVTADRTDIEQMAQYEDNARRRI